MSDNTDPHRRQHCEDGPLAGNAGFVIGPRELTEDRDLGGRFFLHSYGWRTDPDGEALEGT